MHCRLPKVNLVRTVVGIGRNVTLTLCLVVALTLTTCGEYIQPSSLVESCNPSAIRRYLRVRIRVDRGSGSQQSGRYAERFYEPVTRGYTEIQWQRFWE